MYYCLIKTVNIKYLSLKLHSAPLKKKLKKYFNFLRHQSFNWIYYCVFCVLWAIILQSRTTENPDSSPADINIQENYLCIYYMIWFNKWC